MPVAVTLCIGPEGDMDGVPPGECAVRLVNAGKMLLSVSILIQASILTISWI